MCKAGVRRRQRSTHKRLPAGLDRLHAGNSSAGAGMLAQRQRLKAAVATLLQMKSFF